MTAPARSHSFRLAETYHARLETPPSNLDPTEVVEFLLEHRLFHAAYEMVMDERFVFEGVIIFRLANYYLRRGTWNDQSRVTEIVNLGMHRNAFTRTQAVALLISGRIRTPNAPWINRLSNHID